MASKPLLVRWLRRVLRSMDSPPDKERLLRIIDEYPPKWRAVMRPIAYF